MDTNLAHSSLTSTVATASGFAESSPRRATSRFPEERDTRGGSW